MLLFWDVTGIASICLQIFARFCKSRDCQSAWHFVEPECASGEWEKERHEWMTMEGYGVEYSGMNGS